MSVQIADRWIVELTLATDQTISEEPGPLFSAGFSQQTENLHATHISSQPPATLLPTVISRVAVVGEQSRASVRVVWGCIVLLLIPRHLISSLGKLSCPALLTSTVG